MAMDSALQERSKKQKRDVQGGADKGLVKGSKGPWRVSANGYKAFAAGGGAWA